MRATLARNNATLGAAARIAGYILRLCTLSAPTYSFASFPPFPTLPTPYSNCYDTLVTDRITLIYPMMYSSDEWR